MHKSIIICTMKQEIISLDCDSNMPYVQILVRFSLCIQLYLRKTRQKKKTEKNT